MFWDWRSFRFDVEHRVGSEFSACFAVSETDGKTTKNHRNFLVVLAHEPQEGPETTMRLEVQKAKIEKLASNFCVCALQSQVHREQFATTAEIFFMESFLTVSC